MVCNSLLKGRAYEREVSALLRSIGIPARRSQQYCGGNGDADVIGPENLFIECKRVQSINLHTVMKKAVKDAGLRKTPCIFHRKDNEETLITIRAKDLIKFCKEILDCIKNPE